MSIKPIDLKSSILVNNEASRIRENARANELGPNQYITQHQLEDTQKFETVRNTQATEHRSIRKEDQESEQKKGSYTPTIAKKIKKKSSTENNSSNNHQILNKGKIIDIKA